MVHRNYTKAKQITGGSHKMPAKWSYKRRQQAAAAVQARWNKINGTNKAAVIIIILLYART